MRRILLLAVIFGILEGTAFAGLADVLPKKAFFIDNGVTVNETTHHADSSGRLVNLASDIKMYDTTGTLQGSITAPATNQLIMNITQIGYGISDKLTLALVVPYQLGFTTNLNLGWTPGATSKQLGRPYSEQDFWEYAGSMGQNKPTVYKTSSRLSDMFVVAKYRFLKRSDLQLATMGYVNLQTGVVGDSEYLGSKGTDVYELGKPIGDFGLRIDADKGIFERLTAGCELFVDFFLPQKLPTPAGIYNPLLLTWAPYVGSSYTVKPGPTIGGMFELSFLLVRGSERPTWITRANPESQKSMPPLLTVLADLRLWYCSADDFESSLGNARWNYQQDELALGSVRSKVIVHPEVNLLRYGVPVAFYYEYADQELLGGTNFNPIISNAYGVKLIGAIP